MSVPSSSDCVKSVKRKTAARIGVEISLVLMSGVFGILALWPRDRSDPGPVVFGKAEALETSEDRLGAPDLSPDGKMVAFTGRGEDGITHLFLRHLDQGEAVRLAGTDDATYPFWSPDAEFIAFFTVSGEKLRKIAVGGGPPITICPASNGNVGVVPGNSKSWIVHPLASKPRNPSRNPNHRSTTK